MAYRNIRLHPVLRLIYLLLRILVWLCFKVLYRKRVVLGRENLRFDGPAIVIANHPNTLMDPLNPALSIRQEMFYLANYGLFKHPVTNWLFSRLYCIPVKRKEDVADGEERNNIQAFEKSFQHLEKNGVLFIAVEGTSWMYRYIRPLKSGTARIAFGAEARNDWQLDVKIIPVGLSYSAPNLFRGNVVVNIGAPVYARDWAAAWQQNRQQAVDALMEHLSLQLQQLSIHCRDEAGEELVGYLETVQQNTEPLPPREAYFRTQNMLPAVLDDPKLRELTADYFSQLEQHGLDDSVMAAVREPALLLRTLWYTFWLLLGFPFFLLGYVFWFIPCFIPWWVNKKMDLYIGYSTTVKMLVGIFTFPFALWGVGKLVWYFTDQPELGWLAIAAAILSGLFVEEYQALFQRFQSCRRAIRIATTHPQVLRPLHRLRTAILERIGQEPAP
ncbi:MAG: hypothetical protein EP344_10960 [Bacteroidetes bacterium]|nr:MAG: hypothetical protein EP344_10960 [Bacteroidota bacterium]